MSPTETGRADYATRFQPGVAQNPGGKPKHARNRLQNAFLRDLADDFDANGKAAIKAMREEKPDAYIKAIASLMPRELEISRPLDDISDDDLNAAILAVRACIAAKALGDGEATENSQESASTV